MSVGPNLYAHTGNNGISRIDPSGLDWQLGITGSFTVWPLTFGVGGGLTFGISSDGTIGGTSIFASEQGNAMAGPGVYAGAGLGIVAGHTNGPLTGGGSVSVYGEADAGTGPSVGVSGSYAPSNGSFSGGVSKGLPGAGVGIAAGLGVSYSRTQVSPTVNQAAQKILNYIVWTKNSAENYPKWL